MRWSGRELVLDEGESTIGRYPGCEIVLDSPLVSRKHARLLATPSGVMVEDLGSRNGVLVNGCLISGGVTVLTGDRIQIGDQVLEMLQHARPSGRQANGSEERQRAATVVAMEALEGTADAEEHTRSKNTLDLLAEVVNKAMALGQGDEAERLLSSHLRRVLRDVEHLRSLPPELPEAAVRYAVKLAGVTRKPGWINYTFRVYAGLNRPLPMDVINELYTLLRKVRGVDVSLLRGYVSLLQTQISELGPSQRFAVKRIEGLMALTGL